MHNESGYFRMKGFMLKAIDVQLNEIVDFTEGNLNLHGRRLVLHSMDAFAQFRRDLIEMMGLDQARRILTRFGYFWGQADAAAMERIFQWDNMTEWLLAGTRMHTIEGVAKVFVKQVELDPKSGRFHMEVTWRDSGEAEEHLLELGRSAAPVCWMLVGYASGYASFCFGRDVYFIEQKCRGKGDRVCTAVGRDAESWGDTLKPSLPYFRAEDIQGKVLKLTRELREKTRLLAAARQRVGSQREPVPPFFFEVRSKAFQRVLDLAQRVARFDTSVLITGETGTGKEVVARTIHALSPRKSGPFVAVNCGALPETLLESELFGHKAGAFTGATRDRIGLFEQAGKGTILLDEIGDVAPTMQTKLLRVLQSREIMRVGESTTRKIDVRVLAATNRDLGEAVADGTFREDLLYRLRVIEMRLPPLRERTEDILPLARYFVRQLSERLGMPDLRLHATCLGHLQSHTWPGNVRELENAMEHAAVLCEASVIRPEFLPSTLVRPEPSAGRRGDAARRTLAQAEMDHIQAVLKSVSGNRTHAAKVLAISPTTLWRKLKNQE